MSDWNVDLENVTSCKLDNNTIANIYDIQGTEYRHLWPNPPVPITKPWTYVSGSLKELNSVASYSEYTCNLDDPSSKTIDTSDRSLLHLTGFTEPDAYNLTSGVFKQVDVDSLRVDVSWYTTARNTYPDPDYTSGTFELKNATTMSGYYSPSNGYQLYESGQRTIIYTGSDRTIGGWGPYEGITIKSSGAAPLLSGVTVEWREIPTGTVIATTSGALYGTMDKNVGYIPSSLTTGTEFNPYISIDELPNNPDPSIELGFTVTISDVIITATFCGWWTLIDVWDSTYGYLSIPSGISFDESYVFDVTLLQEVDAGARSVYVTLASNIQYYNPQGCIYYQIEPKTVRTQLTQNLDTHRKCEVTQEVLSSKVYFAGNNYTISPITLRSDTPIEFPAGSTTTSPIKDLSAGGYYTYSSVTTSATNVTSYSPPSIDSGGTTMTALTATTSLDYI